MFGPARTSAVGIFPSYLLDCKHVALEKRKKKDRFNYFSGVASFTKAETSSRVLLLKESRIAYISVSTVAKHRCPDNLTFVLFSCASQSLQYVRYLSLRVLSVSLPSNSTGKGHFSSATAVFSVARCLPLVFRRFVGLSSSPSGVKI